MSSTTSNSDAAASRPPSRRRLLLVGAFGLLLVGAVAIYLALSGARPGGPFVFALVSAAMLCLSVLLLLRTAAAALFEPQGDEVKVATGRRRKELEREKQALLKALKELEFDHEMRKISDDDHREIATRYRARAVRVMRQLDQSATDYRTLAERDVRARVRERAERRAAATPSETEDRS